MPHIKFSGYYFQAFPEGFKRAVAQEVILKMTEAATGSLKANYGRIPVWSGESRGGLREMAEALGVPLNITPVVEHRIRYNKEGRRKSPTSATSLYIEPHRFRVFQVNLSFVNNADGFSLNDTGHGPANLVHPTPWNFTESFRRGIRSRLARSLRNHQFTTRGWLLQKRVYS